jgi:flagellar motor switch protein FliM
LKKKLRGKEADMSGEVLSQEELARLVASSRETGGLGPAAAASFSGRGQTSSRSLPKVLPYDFKRPERVGKEQMRVLQTLHEGFARNFAAALSGLIRSIVEVKLTGVDQLTYSEFIFALDNPTCFNLLKARPLEGTVIVEFSPLVVFALIDRLLGGGREIPAVARRPLTEIEHLLMRRITNLFITELKKAWADVIPLELEIDRVESNPQLVQIVPPNEVVVVISFELDIGDTRGMFNLCIPYNALERISNRLTPNSWVAYGKRDPTPESLSQIGRNLRGAIVQLRAQLAKTRITTAELIGLRVGDIITTAKDVRQPILVYLEQTPKFWARPGVFKGHKAIRIEEIVKDPNEAAGE